MSKISVCMATYNGGKFIKPQIDSILKQIDENDEIVISDDSSTDNTINIIESYADKRIKLSKNNTFHNPVYNFENALKICSGDIIFLADQDDVWDPKKVATMLPLFFKYDLVISDCKVIDGEQRLLSESFFKIRNSGKGFFKNLLVNSYLGCCMAFNRKILLNSLPFPKDIPMHDIWIGMTAEVFGKVNFLEKPLVYYRRHSNSVTVTGTGKKSQFSILDQFLFRYRILKNIVIRFKIQKM